MTIEVQVALIAFFGVILSVLLSVILSFYAARTSIKIENNKLRLDTLKIYETKILDNRVISYPALYCILSKWAKQIRNSEKTKDILIDALLQIEEWDSSNAIFMSAYSTLYCSEFRNYINMKIQNFDEASTNLDDSNILLQKIGDFEYALKNDLGVWGVVGNDDYKVKVKNYEDYLRASERLPKTDKQ